MKNYTLVISEEEYCVFEHSSGKKTHWVEHLSTSIDCLERKDFLDVTAYHSLKEMLNSFNCNKLNTTLLHFDTVEELYELYPEWVL